MPDRLHQKKLRAEKRKYRIRKKISGTSDRPRLVVYKSLKHIYAQLVNDLNGQVLTGVSSLTPEVKKQIKNGLTKTKVSEMVGLTIARKAIEKGIKQIVFDRNVYPYHGRIKALAEKAREGGLKF